VKGAVQVAAGPVPQQGDPSVPHAPAEHAPLLAHMPRPPGHMVPVATQVPATQHPPPQSFPSQQGWFVPPQLAQRPLRPQVFPEALQKAAASPGLASPAPASLAPASPASPASPAPASPAPAVTGAPAQQLWLLAPHPPHPSLTMLQFPSDPPHVVPPFTQMPATQQCLLLQVDPAQQG
jgi:hypothetical protein